MCIVCWLLPIRSRFVFNSSAVLCCLWMDKKGVCYFFFFFFSLASNGIVGMMYLSDEFFIAWHMAHNDVDSDGDDVHFEILPFEFPNWWKTTKLKWIFLFKFLFVPPVTTFDFAHEMDNENVFVNVLRFSHLATYRLSDVNSLLINVFSVQCSVVQQCLAFSV